MAIIASTTPAITERLSPRVRTRETAVRVAQREGDRADQLGQAPLDDRTLANPSPT